jgi:F0F1-type ATP synthase membrane subunit c/vacuolar-type H+-ATPase subunit K
MAIDRRALIGAGLGAGLGATMAAEALAQSVSRGNAVSEVSAPARPEPTAKYRVPFAVVGLDHAHIY